MRRSSTTITYLLTRPLPARSRIPKYIADLRAKLATLDTKLEIVWVIADEEACHQRMIARNSSRDYWKLEHWDEYIKTRDFTTPAIEGLHTVNNSTDTSYIEDLNRLIEDMKNS